jgi:predicted nucleic acid-binding protein
MRIIIDANVIKDIARGNVELAQALTRLIKGNKVYIAKAAYDELTGTAPTKQLCDAYRSILEELEIGTPPRTDMAERVDVYKNNIEYVQPGPNAPGPMKQYGGKYEVVNGEKVYSKPGDAFVAAETKAFKAHLLTVDRRFAGQARAQGVNVLPESFTIKGVSGTENPAQARRLLGIDLRAKIARLMSRLGSVKVALSGMKESIGVSLRGSTGQLALRILGDIGIEAIFMLVGAWLQARQDKADLEEGLERVQGEIVAKMQDAELIAAVAKAELTLDEGETVYIVYSVEIHFGTPAFMDPYYKEQYDKKLNRLKVFLAKDGLQLHAAKRPPWHPDDKEVTHFIDGRIESYPKYFEVSLFSKEELADFRELEAEYLHRKLASMRDPTNQVRQEELLLIRQQIVANFGDDVWFLQLEKADAF